MNKIIKRATRWLLPSFQLGHCVFWQRADSQPLLLLRWVGFVLRFGCFVSGALICSVLALLLALCLALSLALVLLGRPTSLPHFSLRKWPL